MWMSQRCYKTLSLLLQQSAAVLEAEKWVCKLDFMNCWKINICRRFVHAEQLAHNPLATEEPQTCKGFHHSNGEKAALEIYPLLHMCWSKQNIHAAVQLGAHGNRYRADRQEPGEHLFHNVECIHTWPVNVNFVATALILWSALYTIV